MAYILCSFYDTLFYFHSTLYLISMKNCRIQHSLDQDQQTTYSLFFPFPQYSLILLCPPSLQGFTTLSHDAFPGPVNLWPYCFLWWWIRTVLVDGMKHITDKRFRDRIPQSKMQSCICRYRMRDNVCDVLCCSSAHIFSDSHFPVHRAA